MKAGHVANIHEAEEAIRHAVDLAERAASVQLESVAVSVSAGRLASETFNACVDVAGIEGRPTTTSRACSPPAAAIRRATAGWCMHSLPIGFSLDDARGVREPRGMLARQFGVDMHVVDRRHRDAPQPDARGRAMPSHRRGDGGVPLYRRPCRSWPTTSPISAPPWSIWAPEPRPSRSSRAAASSMPTASRSAGST